MGVGMLHRELGNERPYRSPPPPPPPPLFVVAMQMEAKGVAPPIIQPAQNPT